MSTPSQTNEPGAASRALEAVGLLLVLAAIGLFLVRANDLHAYSDPKNWFLFARHFAERFGVSHLAYGFPLVAAAAIRIAGVFHGFLVNVPILLGLAVLVHAITRGQIPDRLARPAWVAPFGAAVALLLLVRFDMEVLAKLANPYRDPLSHALVLLCFWLVIRYRRNPSRSLAGIAAAGLALAYACSTREAAVFMLLPLFVYATASRLEQRSLPYLKPLLVFGAAFAVGCIPLLVQNLMVSGNPLMPAQATRGFAKTGDLVPGVQAGHLFDVFPEILAYLGSHLGVVGLALLLVGLVAALATWQGGILFLLLPAALVYLLFYGSYYQVVSRYLFVIALFALPIAGVGAATLLQLVLRPIPRVAVQRGLAALALAAAYLGTVLTAHGGWSPDVQLFRLAGARKLQQDFARLLPEDARVIGEDLLGQILACFLDQEALELKIQRRTGAIAPKLRERVRSLADRPGPLYAASRGATFERFLRSEFDLLPLVRLPTARYGLRRLLKKDAVLVQEVRPWSRLETRTRLRAERSGEQLLAVDVGQLSKQPRSFARVRWGDEVLDEQPLDGRNYYRVSVDDPVDVAVGLTSDRPVPAAIRAKLLPLDQQLLLDFGPSHVLDFTGRLSDSFQVGNRRHPTVGREGFVDAPTPGGRDAFFVFVADIEFRGRHAGYKQNLTIRAGDVPLFHATFVQSEDRQGRHNQFPSTALFWAGPPVVGVHNTRLHWELDSRSGGDPEPLTLRSLTVHRHRLAKRMWIDLGSPGDETFVIDGVHARESTVADALTRYRWTRELARLRVFTWPGGRPLRLSVSYLSGARPPAAPAAEPRLRFNGHPLAGASRRESAGRFERVTRSFELPAEWVEPGMNELEIRSATWIPAESGDSEDRRALGIMLDRVSIERESAS